VNDDGVLDAGDVLVPDSAWLGGVQFVSNHPFVVPVGCDHVFGSPLPAPLHGVRVIATKVTFQGVLQFLFSGGEGATFIADPSQVPAPGLGNGDIIVGNGANHAIIEGTGTNKLSVAIEALPKSSVALWAAGNGTPGSGTCDISVATLRGNPVTGSGKVGILCEDDITIRQTTMLAAGINIQSLSGKIDARSAAPLGGPTLADLCDNPVSNLTGNGNSNSIADAPDFPCQLDLGAQFPGVTTFPTLSALVAFCTPSAIAGVNVFQALNNPLIMISKEDLDLSGVAGGETVVVGKFRVTLAAEDGNIDTSNTNINNSSSPPGGARIDMFADPNSVVRLPADKEDFFGPSGGSIDIESACYESPNPVRVGQDGGGAINLVGTPDGPPCKQNVLPNPPFEGFVPILNLLF
jgi:hypothetical protein